METRANYLLVGSFVLIMFAGVIGFVIWLAKVQFDVELRHYDIFFSSPVTGLHVGSPVSYRGIRVGEVTKITIDPDNIDMIRVTIEVQTDTPIRENTVASVELQGITGGSFILLSGGTQDAPPLEAKPDQDHPVIASRPSSLQQVLTGAPEVIDNVNLLLTMAKGFLSKENRDNLDTTLANLANLSETLAGERENVRRLIKEATAAMGDVRGTAATFDQMAKKLNREVPGLVTKLRVTASSVESMANQIEEMVAENREPLRQFTAEGLIELINLLAELRDFVFTLRRVTTQVERSPVQFFFGNQRQGYVPGR